MADKQEKKSFVQKIRNKYRLVIYNDSTFEEVWFMRLSRLNLFAVLGTLTILFVALLFVLIAYTSVREIIPGYPDGTERRTNITNNLMLDSVEHRLQIVQQYQNNIKTILLGEDPENFEITRDSNRSYKNISFQRSIEDSLLRKQVEEEEKFNLAITETDESDIDFRSLHFFTPVKGIVTNSINATRDHYGTDIVAGPNEVVKATLDGTILMATWTLETGYIIQIQHKNNLISVYKHNAELLKKVGSHVKAGDAIAIIGNSGELSTGPHLHFELWHNGTPINPEEYIVF